MCRVSIKHWETEQMDVADQTFEAQPHANVEERLLTVRGWVKGK